MKDIVTNKRKIPEAEISTMLANYTFNFVGKFQLLLLEVLNYLFILSKRNMEIQEYQLYHATLKETMLKLLYVILEPMLVLCLYLYIIDLI